MIKLNKDSGNRVVVTASENVTLTGNTYFLFEVISDDTKQSKFFTGEDISLNTCRYNEFNVIVTGDTFENLTASTINLDLNGYYKYNIYQQDSPTNLSLSGTSGIVETGILYLSGETKPNITTYTGNSDNNTFITYQ